jgi:hypothetical protein
MFYIVFLLLFLFSIESEFKHTDTRTVKAVLAVLTELVLVRQGHLEGNEKQFLFLFVFN